MELGAEEQIFPMQPERVGRGWIAAAGMTVLGYTLASEVVPLALGGQPIFIAQLLVMGLLWGVGSFYTLRHVLRGLRKAPRQVRILPGALVLPADPTVGGPSTVPFDRIRSLHRQRGEQGALVIGSEDRVHILRAGEFSHPATLPTLFAAIGRQIAAQPGARTRLLEMGDRQRRAALLARIRPRVSHGLLGVIVAVFVLQLMVGASGENAPAMVQFGNLNYALVAAGQWWRVFTATFMHGNEIHILFNGVALYFLGDRIERALGGAWYLTVHLASALGGAALSYAWHTYGPSPFGAPIGLFGSVGASGAVFGLVGALGALQLRHGAALPIGFHQPRRWWIWILGLNGFISLALPMIDGAAHLGGFLVGAALVWVGCRSVPEPRQATPRPVLALAAGLCVAAAMSLVTAATRDDQAQDARVVLTSVVDAPEVDPIQLNNPAWFVAIDPDAPTDVLRLAERAAQRAVDQLPEQATLIDTLATVRHRLGHSAEAVALERQALVRDDRTLIATQLARFLEGAPAEARGSTLKALNDTTGVRYDGPAPATVFAIGYAGDRRIGLVAARAHEAGALRWDTIERPPGELDRIEVRLVIPEADDAHPPPVHRGKARWWDEDPEVTPYPN
jgi:rhomboid protease GluP